MTGPPDPVDFAPADPAKPETADDGIGEIPVQEEVSADDQSLTSAEYINLGMPAPNRNWIGTDMEAAAAVLTKLAASEPEKLPRYRSPRSGAMLDRMSSDENHDILRDQSLPLESRMADATQMMQACNSIIKLYLQELVRGNRGSDECIELVGTQLRLGVVMMRLVNSFLPTVDSNDSRYAIRMDGLRKMRVGFAGMIAGAVTMLSERDTHSVSGRKRLLRSMGETLGEILAALPEENRAETRTRLTALQRDPRMGDLEPELSELLDAISTADESP